ncbi:FHA domain-containing protein DDL, partial [Asbolus verrucosus]
QQITMGSKKKKEVSESSSSSSESESENSDTSSDKRPKHKSKKQTNKSVEPESDTENARASSKKSKSKTNVKKRESSPLENENDESHSYRKRSERKPSSAGDDLDKEAKQGKRRRSPSPESRDRKVRDDKRAKDDRGRYDFRRNSTGDHNNRAYDDRYRNRRGDYRSNFNKRDRRDDRDREYRGRREDNRNYSNRDRERNNRENYQRRRSRSNSFDHANAKWGKDQDDKKTDKKDTKDKQKPNFSLSGKLTEETNTYRGVVIKYSEPPEARKPKRRWRLYPFKGEKALQTLYIHRESAYLIGRDRKVVDLPVDHPSCSKQHAALQYRLVPFTREDGTAGKRVRPYLIDLNSANGTYINNKKIEPSKYVELLEKDVIKFGYSSREYVLLHENSKDEAQDDDVKQEEEVVMKNEES